MTIDEIDIACGMCEMRNSFTYLFILLLAEKSIVVTSLFRVRHTMNIKIILHNNQHIL